MTMFFDVIAVFGVGAATAAIALHGRVMWVQRRARSEVARKNVPYLVASAAFGLLWMWATLVANQGMYLGRPFTTLIEWTGCTAWSVWGQYFFGLNAWLTAINLRFNYYAMVFDSRNVIPARDYKKWQLLLAFVCSLPMFFLCTAITLVAAAAASIYTTAEHSCNGFLTPLEHSLLFFFTCYNLCIMVAFFLMTKTWPRGYIETQGMKRAAFLVFTAAATTSCIETVGWTTRQDGLRFLVTVIPVASVLYYYAVVLYSIEVLHRERVKGHEAPSPPPDDVTQFRGQHAIELPALLGGGWQPL